MSPDSIYGVLHRECFNLFPDEMFADLFTVVGRRSVPPMIVAVVMVLQRIEGLSDREAVERFAFDARWCWRFEARVLSCAACTRPRRVSCSSPSKARCGANHARSHNSSNTRSQP